MSRSRMAHPCHCRLEALQDWVNAAVWHCWIVRGGLDASLQLLKQRPKWNHVTKVARDLRQSSHMTLGSPCMLILVSVLIDGSQQMEAVSFGDRRRERERGKAFA